MRFVSFTFDDGLINSAQKIIELKIPSTFYLVTGWVTKDSIIEDYVNKDLNHGCIKSWLDLSNKGLDIGSHGHSHKIFNEIKDFEQDSLKSFSIIKENFNKICNFSYPYGEKKFNFIKFSSTKSGFSTLYNKISSRQISSINPFYDLKNIDLKEVINKMPDNLWLVLTFHGINEGWMPCDENYLIDHYKFCIDNKIKVKTISDVILMKKIC